MLPKNFLSCCETCCDPAWFLAWSVGLGWGLIGTSWLVISEWHSSDWTPEYTWNLIFEILSLEMEKYDSSIQVCLLLLSGEIIKNHKNQWISLGFEWCSWILWWLCLKMAHFWTIFGPPLCQVTGWSNRLPRWNSWWGSPALSHGWVGQVSPEMSWGFYWFWVVVKITILKNMKVIESHWKSLKHLGKLLSGSITITDSEGIQNYASG